MKQVYDILEKTLGIRSDELTFDPGVAKLLCTALRVKDCRDCEQALCRAIHQVRAIRRELSREPLPPDNQWWVWIDTAATRLTAEMKLSSRAWIELDTVILEAAEAITALAFDAREHRRPSGLGAASPRVTLMLVPRLETCIGRLEDALQQVRLLQQGSHEELVKVLRACGRCE